MSKIKIALCGKIRSGKDTVADFLKDNHNFTAYRFAKGIWEVGRMVFPSAFDNPNNKPRRLLQDIGQHMRKVEPDVWIDYTLRQIYEENESRIVVTDLRQPNEFLVLKKAGYFVVRVSSEFHTRYERATANNDDFKYEDMFHETESHIDGFQVDFEIRNNGTLEELKKQTDLMYEEAIFVANQ